MTLTELSPAAYRKLLVCRMNTYLCRRNRSLLVNMLPPSDVAKSVRLPGAETKNVPPLFCLPCWLGYGIHTRDWYVSSDTPETPKGISARVAAAA